MSRRADVTNSHSYENGGQSNLLFGSNYGLNHRLQTIEIIIQTLAPAANTNFGYPWLLKMFGDNDSLESLKLKLKSVTKQKLSQEREVLKLRNKERALRDELNTTKADVELLTEHLKLLKNQITQSKHQISMIDMCMASEDLKVESHIDILNEHLGGFQRLFDRDRREIEQRIKEQREKEAKLQEDVRQKEKLIAEENQKQMREAAAIEEECEVVERECAVLKKRNHAIMLKLRKRLLEAENTRREVMKRKLPQISTNNENETN